MLCVCNSSIALFIVLSSLFYRVFDTIKHTRTHAYIYIRIHMHISLGGVVFIRNEMSIIYLSFTGM